MDDPVQKMLNEAFEAHKAGKMKEALAGYGSLLNRNPYNDELLFLIGNVFLQQNQNGMAIAMLEAALRSNAKNAGAWNDLGCALKAEHFNEAAALAWEKALEVGGANAGTLNNLATLWADSGYPEKALPLVEEAMKLDPANPHVHWNRALALLTQGNWAEGWDEHEYRKAVSAKNVAPRSYGPEWAGQETGTVVIHGEQGIGDEIMFSTCIPDFRRQYPGLRILIECHPKLVGLFERSFGVPCYGSQEELMKVTPYLAPDYQIGMGSLPKLLRRSDDDFPREPRAVLKPDPALVEEAKILLGHIKGPLVGVSWLGGTKVTRVQHRSLSAAALKAMVPPGATAVSLQYGMYTDIEADEVGLIRLGDWTDGTNLEKLAAVVSLMDDVVSVCTTLIHLAGAMGRSVHVLTPLRSSWRYGQRSGPGGMLWYPQHTLHRQAVENDWAPVIEEVTQLLKEKYA